MAGMRGRGRAGVVRLGAVAAVVPLLAGCWRQAGFDAAHTWSNGSETGLTAANVGTLAPVWSVAEGSHGEAIVTDGRVYLSQIGADGGQLVGVVKALDAATGAMLWDQRTLSVTADSNQTFEALPPTAVGDEVWGGFEAKNAFRQDTVCASALVRLDAATGAVIADGGGFGTTPVPAGPVIAQTVTPDSFCQRDNTSIVVRDSSSLATIWSAPTGFPTTDNRVGPTVAGGQLYETGFFSVRAFAAAGCGAATCDPVWTYEAPQFELPLGPVTAPAGDEVYVVKFHGFGSSPLADLVALTAATGEVAWQTPIDVPDASADRVKLAADGNSVYVAVSTQAGRRVTAYPVGGCGAPTCSPTWTGSTSQDDGFSSSRPVVAGGIVYLPDTAGVHAFAAEGCGAATCSAIADIPIPGGARFLTVDGGRLYVIGGDGLTAFAPT